MKQYQTLSKVMVYFTCVLFLIIIPTFYYTAYYLVLPISYIFVICETLLINDNVKDKCLLNLFKILIGVALTFINILFIHIMRDSISAIWTLIIQTCFYIFDLGLCYVAYYILKER